MRSYTVSAGTTATRVCPSATEVAANGISYAGTVAQPASIHVQNTGAATVYLGGSDVSTTNGFPLAASASVEIDLQSDALYCVSAAGGEVLAVLRTS